MFTYYSYCEENAAGSAKPLSLRGPLGPWQSPGGTFGKLPVIDGSEQEIASSGFALLAMTVIFGSWIRWTGVVPIVIAVRLAPTGGALPRPYDRLRRAGS